MRSSSFPELLLCLGLVGCGDPAPALQTSASATATVSADASSVEAEWVLEKPADAGFSVRMPKGAAFAETKLPMDLVQKSITHSAPEGVLQVVWVVLPPTIDGPTVLEKNVEGMKDAAPNLTNFSELPFEPQGFRGKEIRFTKDGRDHVARSIWVPPRMYVVEAGGLTPEARAAFLDSFALDLLAPLPASSPSASSSATALPP